MNTPHPTFDPDSGLTTYKGETAGHAYRVVGNVEGGWSLWYAGEEISPSRGVVYRTLRGVSAALRTLTGETVRFL